MKLQVWMFIVTVMGWCVAPRCPAGMIGPLNNTTDDLVVDGQRSEWSALQAFEADSAGEPGIGEFDVDWNRVTVANQSDLNMFFFRCELHKGADFGSYPAFYNIFVDADRNRATGYIGSDGQLPIGADYLIQGGNLFSFGGGSEQTAFGWTLTVALTTDNSFSNRDISLAVPALVIGNPSSFHFVLLGDNALSGNTSDYYPDGGNRGADGDYFEYTTTPANAAE